MRDYVLVLPLVPVSVGDSFSRRSWPLHVTIVGNFRTKAGVDELVLALESALGSRRDVVLGPVTLGEQAMFGPQGDVLVNVVIDENDRLASLHELLLGSIGDQVELLEPHHALGGYRPHVTAAASTHTQQGDRWELRSLTLVDLDWHGVDWHGVDTQRDDSLTRVVWTTDLG
jgi:hypothetical protein